MTREELVIPVCQGLPHSSQGFSPEPRARGGLYRYSGLTWTEIHWAVALERVSVDTLSRCERLASHRSSSGTPCCWPLAASFAYWFAIPLPAMPECAGTQRMVM